MFEFLPSRKKETESVSGAERWGLWSSFKRGVRSQVARRLLALGLVFVSLPVFADDTGFGALDERERMSRPSDPEDDKRREILLDAVDGIREEVADVVHEDQEDDLEDDPDYQRGFNHGYSEGYVEGYELGFGEEVEWEQDEEESAEPEEEYSDAYAEGFWKAFDEGREEGLREGEVDRDETEEDFEWETEADFDSPRGFDGSDYEDPFEESSLPLSKPVRLSLDLDLDFRSPGQRLDLIYDVDSINKAVASSNRLVALGLDRLMGDEVLLRPLKAFVNLYWQSFSSFVAHETAHMRTPQREGFLQTYTYDFRHLRMASPMPLRLFPSDVKELTPDFSEFSTDNFTWKMLTTTIAGVNQLTAGRQYLLSRSLCKDTLLPNEGLDYLINSFAPGSSAWGYILASLIDPSIETGRVHGETSDINFYIDTMSRLKGYELSKDQMFLSSSLAVFGSMETYRSFGVVMNEVLRFVNDLLGSDIGMIPILDKGFELGGQMITWPHLGYWLTPDGEYMDVSMTVNPDAEWSLSLNVGRDLDFTQNYGTWLNRWRFGLGVGYRRKGFELDASAALNLERRGGALAGFHLGGEAAFQVSDEAWFTVGVSWQQGDVMQNVIKEKPESEVWVGLKVRG